MPIDLATGAHLRALHGNVCVALHTLPDANDLAFRWPLRLTAGRRTPTMKRWWRAVASLRARQPARRLFAGGVVIRCASKAQPVVQTGRALLPPNLRNPLGGTPIMAQLA
jgi:hypothetical protein